MKSRVHSTIDKIYLLLSAIVLASNNHFCIAAEPSSDAVPPEQVQVLLIGEDPQRLEQALIRADGKLTHRLPIIHGIGGNLPTQALATLIDAPGVRRVIEDFNPPASPPKRDCDIAGGLEIDLTGRQLTWSVYNFSQQPRVLTELSVSWPTSIAPPVTMVLAKTGIDLAMTSSRKNNTIHIEKSLPALPVGSTALRIQFTEDLSNVTQNDFEISMTAGCHVALARAYPDNANDYYYNRVIGADLLHTQGITGKEITVAVLDSGFWEHKALQRATDGRERVLARYDAITDSSPAQLTDESGHGTHISSIIANSTPTGLARTNSARGYKGVAPDVNLVPVKVVDSTGNADYLDIVRGLQWILDNHAALNIRVVNISLAATPRFDYWDDPVNQAVLKLWQAGITVVAAAGNDGPEASSIGSPGNNPYVITVGAVTDSWTPEDRNDDYIPDFSSRGPTAVGHIKPDLVAPGGHITGLVPSDSTLARESPDYLLRNGDFVATGSSQAAAVVSGIAALLLQLEPGLTNNDIKCMLTSSAEPAINADGRLAYSPFTQGHGYASAARAITLGDRGCGNTDLDVDAAVTGNEQAFGPTTALSDGNPSLPGLGDLLTQTPTEKGASETRRWGVKAHIERLDLDNIIEPTNIAAGWLDAYLHERAQMQSLTESPAP